jgi:hypothetical protein
MYYTTRKSEILLSSYVVFYSRYFQLVVERSFVLKKSTSRLRSAVRMHDKFVKNSHFLQEFHSV